MSRSVTLGEMMFYIIKFLLSQSHIHQSDVVNTHKCIKKVQNNACFILKLTLVPWTI